MLLAREGTFLANFLCAWLHMSDLKDLLDRSIRKIAHQDLRQLSRSAFLKSFRHAFLSTQLPQLCASMKPYLRATCTSLAMKLAGGALVKRAEKRSIAVLPPRAVTSLVHVGYIPSVKQALAIVAIATNTSSKWEYIERYDWLLTFSKQEQMAATILAKFPSSARERRSL